MQNSKNILGVKLMGWVTINGRHVLIEKSATSRVIGGHKGNHNPATSTGNPHTDKALLRTVDESAVKNEPRNLWYATKQKHKLATYF